MRILHVTNGYADSKVHSNLAMALDELGVEQMVYCPVREERLMGKNKFEGKNIQFVYSFCIKSWYKYVYQYKRWMLYRDMKRKVNLKDFDVIHAATLFSDGGLALKAHKKYGIPYIIAVRSTDINLYIRRLKHTHRIGKEIVLNASRVVFISKTEMKEFLESEFVKTIYEKINNKIVFQPNGIDDYWLNHVSHEEHKGHEVLYIGNFTIIKNVSRLAKAVLQLRQMRGFEDVRLMLVGGNKLGGVWKNDELLQQIIANHPDAITALGCINDKEKLAEVMHSCALFAMPSIHETFGLVYLEALSQNLPVVYTKGQGIDGIFDESVGIGVDALSVEEIRDAIHKILDHLDDYGNQKVCFDDFNWKKIAKRYIDIYNEVQY